MDILSCWYPLAKATPSWRRSYSQDHRSKKPNTSSRPSWHSESEIQLTLVTHGNQQLHHDQPGCHFLFWLSESDLKSPKFGTITNSNNKTKLCWHELVQLKQNKKWQPGWSWWSWGLPWVTFLTSDLESPHFQGHSDVLGFQEHRFFSRTDARMVWMVHKITSTTKLNG